ncbi:MAG: UbiA prenyltransferase [Fibrobacteres bacterium]|nr:UbiA prenyltransferase [Fibrobacterota bacterium]
MYRIRARIREMKPAFPLFYLSFMGFLCLYSVQRYLGLGFEPLNCMTFMGIIFGVYTLNRFTDTAEDFTNDIGRLLFFQGKRIFLFLAGTSLAGSIGVLLYLERLNWMHVLLLTMGFGYSFRLVPWYSRASGLRFLRIKEMTFVKNLSVSFLWGASVFMVPILSSEPMAFDGGMILLLAAGLFVSTFNNTLFDDIMDEAGDRVAGIRTLPTVWGGFKSQMLLMAMDTAWVAMVAALWLEGRIGGGHASFLAFLGLYPFLYMALHLRGKTEKSWVDLLSESDLLFFALGMLLLGTR